METLAVALVPKPTSLAMSFVLTVQGWGPLRSPSSQRLHHMSSKRVVAMFHIVCGRRRPKDYTTYLYKANWLLG